MIHVFMKTSRHRYNTRARHKHKHTHTHTHTELLSVLHYACIMQTMPVQPVLVGNTLLTEKFETKKLIFNYSLREAEIERRSDFENVRVVGLWDHTLHD